MRECSIYTLSLRKNCYYCMNPCSATTTLLVCVVAHLFSLTHDYYYYYYVIC